MCVGDGNCEGVGGVRPRDFRPGQQARHHRMDLYFFRIAVADDGLFHQPGGVFGDRYAAASGCHQDDSPRLAKLEGRLWVLVDEHFLDRRRVGSDVGNQRLELASQVREPFRQRRGSICLQLSVGDVGKSVALCLDNAPAGRAEPRVEAEDFQASFSSSSSGTS